MDCAVGIDLGSTTTKAVVLDPQGEILGRGITNTRNNYAVACALARSEAFVAARFALLRRVLAADAAAGDAGATVPRLEAAFRCEQYLDQLATLRVVALAELEAPVFGAARPALARALPRVFDAMAAEAPAHFAPGTAARSDFFRDHAQSRYLAHADAEVATGAVTFERLTACFDKAILKVENRPQDLSFEAHAGRAVTRVLAGADTPPAARTRLAAVVETVAAQPLVERAAVGTGYGRQTLPFEKSQIRSEILCHGLGAHAMFADTRTVLDIGGQDTKAIQVDGAGIVTAFQMNDRCAAGCGRYLGYIADEMNLGLHELGPLAQRATRPVRITSTCTVFAGAEIRDRLTAGQSREDILGGLHRAIMLRAMSLLARSGGVHDAFTFTGGVARNPAAVAALRRLVSEHYGERVIHISADSIYTGAIGAALFAWRGLQGAPAPAEVAA